MVINLLGLRRVLYVDPGGKGERCGVCVGPLGCCGFGIRAFEKCIVVCRGMYWEFFCYDEGMPRGEDECRGWGWVSG